MSRPTGQTASRSIGAIVFDLVLVGFAGLLVVNALGLRPGVGTVPLLVGVPTLLGAVVLLVRDAFPRAAPALGGSGDGSGGGFLKLIPDADDDEDADDRLPDDPASRRRQVAFTAWVIGFVVLATLTSFYVAVPIALLGILLAVRIHWLVAIAITVATVVGFYGLFDLFLGVRL